MDCAGWTSLNNGDPTRTSYRPGGQTAPDVAARVSWSLSGGLGSDHLPMLLEVRGCPGNKIRTKTRWAFARVE